MCRSIGAGILAVFLIVGGEGVRAEEPTFIFPSVSLPLGVGRSITMRFESVVGTAGVDAEGVATVIPRSDHLLTLVGVAPGQTVFRVLGTDGREIYSANVVVNPQPGHEVKFYGFPNIKDYLSYFCTGYTCGRVDLDMPQNARGGGAPSSSSVTITRTLPSGASEQSTKNFGGQ